MSLPADRKLLVIGSGPAGVSAAVGYRDAGGSGAVHIVTCDDELPYERPPLSKDLLRGEARPDEIRLHPADFYAERDIEISLSTIVATLDTDARTATLDDGRVLNFEFCVLATGSRSVRPPVPGAELPHVHALRSLGQAIALRDAARHAGTVVVVGSGFIGCEAAASLSRSGVSVTLVTVEDQPHAARLGTQVAERIADWLRNEGVEVITGDGIAEITAHAVTTKSGRNLPAEQVLLATGVEPCGELAERAGLRMSEGRVRVDSSMRASAAGVFAAGDVALATNDAAGRAVAVEHWGDALTMGEIAGRAAAGEVGTWAQAPGFWSTIGGHTLKYSAWGDGHDDVLFRDGTHGAFTAWYLRDSHVVGVLTHEADEDYERGPKLVEDAAGAAALN